MSAEQNYAVTIYRRCVDEVQVMVKAHSKKEARQKAVEASWEDENGVVTNSWVMSERVVKVEL
jgi:hypothetical protein